MKHTYTLYLFSLVNGYITKDIKTFKISDTNLEVINGVLKEHLAYLAPKGLNVFKYELPNKPQV